MNFKLPVKLIKRKNWYVANCPVLDVSSQGDTPSKAKKNLKAALSVFFITCIEQGTLDAVLQECGFEPIYGKKGFDAQKSDYVNIPIPMIASQPFPIRCPA